MRIADWQLYGKALFAELESRKDEISSPSTLYIGGGTPSIVPPEILHSWVARINNIFNISQWEEFTLEVNPEDISEEACKLWKESGVNRISLGVQSLSDIELKAIKRRHDSKTTLRNYETLKKFFGNISVDLMFGLPAQTLTSYKESLNGVIAMSPQHISSYSLMLEEGTAMTLLANSGKVKLPDETKWMKMFDLTSASLECAGYRRYEVSNFALPGFESRHNSGYWKNMPYLGLGPGAHSYNGNNIRRMNPCDLKGYIIKFTSGKVSGHFYREEILSAQEQREEMVMTRLRLCQGMDLKEFESGFGSKSKDELITKAAPWVDKGLVVIADGFIKITSKGIPLGNTIISDLF